MKQFENSNQIFIKRESIALEQAAPESAPAQDGGDSLDFSETNNQVENVDEADLIKTDGNYVYTISNGVVSIVKSFPANEAEVVAEIDVKD